MARALTDGTSFFFVGLPNRGFGRRAVVDSSLGNSVPPTVGCGFLGRRLWDGARTSSGESGALAHATGASGHRAVRARFRGSRRRPGCEVSRHGPCFFAKMAVIVGARPFRYASNGGSMGDKSPKNKQREKKQQTAAKGQAKTNQASRQASFASAASKDKK